MPADLMDAEPTRSQIRIARRAIRGRWPVAPAVRHQVVNALRRVLRGALDGGGDGPGYRLVVGAAKARFGARGPGGSRSWPGRAGRSSTAWPLTSTFWPLGGTFRAPGAAGRLGEVEYRVLDTPHGTAARLDYHGPYGGRLSAEVGVAFAD